MKPFQSLFALGALAVVFAGCQSHSHTNTSDAKPYTLKTCIVSDEDLGSMGDPVVKVVNGQEVKFCCKSCVGDFDKNPQKYLSKLK
jgi:hypothetical protein